ncbi:MAG: ATP-dependent 6-phosphofructokinase [Chthoniobacterales bacterium]|jgi:6-phosphofructokinase 1|nr:ATP-dependent 6-phosphofructokinase [Chthoniobacterales bacterium]
MSPKRIGVLTSGGDCPGLNAVLRGVYSAATELGWEVLGLRDGFEGMLVEGGDTMVLNRENTAGIMQVGGTILGTTNKGHFTSKIAGGERSMIPEEVIAKASKTCRKLDLSAIIAIGGDGSMSTALQLYRAGFPMIGVPKTIDNDLEATAMTFGFDSAVACVTDALDRLHTTAASHKRAIVVQVMGRHAGWIALWGGLAGAADIILIPEIPFSLEKVAEVVQKRDEAGFKSTMIVVAEGARTSHGQQFRKQSASGEWRLGGIGEMIAQEVEARSKKETRVCVLGHLQRGGDPTTLDRILGISFGVKAVQLAREERFGTMVSYQNYEVLDVPIAEAIHHLKKVSPDCQLVGTARALGISFGD